MNDVVQLDGRWRLRQAGSAEWIPAMVPGCVHTDLLAAGRIPDPLVGTSELDVLWVDEVDWEYERSFEISAELLTCRGQWLICDGLDTVAEISINDQPVAETCNMFRRFRFDVAPYLREGTNHIRITFRSPIHYARRQSEKLSYELPGTEYDWGTGRTRKVYRPYIRKSQCQFGWDWGPCLPTSGIWRGIRLIATDAPIIEYLTTRQEHEAGCVTLTVSAHLAAAAEAEGQLAVRIGDALTVVPSRVAAGESVLSAEVVIEAPTLWWPRGHGGQHLYPVEVCWLDDSGVERARATTRVGLRTVELVREPDDVGESFFLRINGSDIFCRGANWIPADAFPTRVSPDRYERLVLAAADANMNMLRVWGGGVYEDQAFYDLCDELGLLVWQDFMFACAAYPGDREFLDEVGAEARHQVRRLHNHPSIVLWCGDNEDELAVDSWWHQKESDPPLRPDYDRLIVGTLAPIVAAEDPQRPWWPSSPSNGGQGDPNDLTRGDTHFWEVWHGGKPFERYLEVTPRFCSEFGFQSFPSLTTLHTAVDPGVTDITDPVMLHHQRHGRGNTIIADAMARLFHEPSTLDDLCYLSQVTHGLALQYGVEHWRRRKPHCMGTLYWQLQDCWVVASWASVDYELRYKAAHFMAKRFYAPLLGSVVRRGDDLDIWATSDVPADLEGTCTIEAWTTTGELTRRIQEPFSLPANASKSVATVSSDVLFGPDVPVDQRLIRLTLSAGDHQHETCHALAPYKTLDLRTSVIQAVVNQTNDGLQVLVSADVPALFVELASGPVDGVFTDNYFALFPGEPKRLGFTAAGEVTAADLQCHLAIRTLRSTYAR